MKRMNLGISVIWCHLGIPPVRYGVNRNAASDKDKWHLFFMQPSLILN